MPSWSMGPLVCDLWLVDFLTICQQMLLAISMRLEKYPQYRGWLHWPCITRELFFKKVVDGWLSNDVRPTWNGPTRQGVLGLVLFSSTFHLNYFLQEKWSLISQLRQPRKFSCAVKSCFWYACSAYSNMFLAVQTRVWQLNRWPCHWGTDYVNQSLLIWEHKTFWQLWLILNLFDNFC